MENKINTYTCPKGHITVTIDKDEGVTPMMLRCKQKDGVHNCTEMASSGWYMVNENLTPEYEWYKPKDFKKLNRSEREHAKMGGLLLRKIDTSR